jgi:hypothetical protein
MSLACNYEFTNNPVSEDGNHGSFRRTILPVGATGESLSDKVEMEYWERNLQDELVSKLSSISF